MNIHLGKRLFVVGAVLGALAVFAIGFFVALEVRGVVAGPDSAPAAAPPNPGHTYDQIELPVGTWPGLNADMLDGMDAGQTGTDYIPYADASGNVGIGTTSPNSPLHVKSAATEGIFLERSAGGGYGIKIYAGTGDAHIANTADNLYIDATGVIFAESGVKVGIGTTSPTQRLEVDGGIRLNTATVRPACDSTTRGTLWFTQNEGLGSNDLLEVCAKWGGAYGWRLLSP